MKNKLLLCFLLTGCMAFAQKAMTFQEAARKGKSYEHLDSIYKSAVHSNAKLAVFKSPVQQGKLQNAYIQLLQDLGAFLKKNNFNWETETRGFNRIYIDKDGTIDYFLYNFGKGRISPEKEKEFGRLLEEFAKDYKFSLTAKEKFAQCSPVKYMPEPKETPKP